MALLLSVLIHGLLLCLGFGGQGLGLPGLDLPWRERRLAADELRVHLVAPSGTDSIALVTQKAPSAIVEPRPETGPSEATQASQALVMLAPSPSGGAAVESADGAEPKATAAAPAPALLALHRSDAANWVVPVAVPSPVIAAAPSASSPEILLPVPGDVRAAAQQQIDEALRQRAQLERAEQEAKEAKEAKEAQALAEQLKAARQEATRQEALRQEAARQASDLQQEQVRAEAARLEAEAKEAGRQAAARQESARLEAARQQAERLEAARLEAAKQAAAKQELAKQELAKQEAAKQAAARQEFERAEAARMEAQRQEAARQETARQESARQEQARQDAAQQESTRQESAKQDAAKQEKARQVAAREEQEARREASRRAMGKQLDEEAAKRDAAALATRSPSKLLPESSSLRRGRLFGRTDPNAELLQYAQAWSRKIELNQTFDLVREAARLPHTTPLVTVAVRSDGSVESVTFVLSSGVAAIDEAIRRVVQSQAPFPAFQPGLAREFDVIEIRRSWTFDTAIRLY